MSMLDFIFIIWIAFGIWNGWARGLIAGLTRLVTYLIAIALASRIATPVGERLGEVIGLPDLVREMIRQQVPGSIADQHVTAEQVRPLLDRINIPAEYRTEILNNLPHHTLLDSLALPYIKLMSMILGLVLVTSFLSLLIFALSAPMVRWAQSIFPGFLNRVGGTALGLFLTLVELAFLSLFLSLLTDLPTLSALLKDAIDTSRLMKPLVQLANTILESMGTMKLLPLSFLQPVPLHGL